MYYFFRMLLSCRRLHLPSLIVIWLVCSGVAGGTSQLCPASCTCKPSDKGKRRITCLAGGLSDPIPTGQMDPRTEILEISAPEDRKNWLSVTSIFQVWASQAPTMVWLSTIPIDWMWKVGCLRAYRHWIWNNFEMNPFRYQWHLN